MKKSTKPLKRKTPLKASLKVIGEKKRGKRYVSSDQKKRIRERDDDVCYLCGGFISGEVLIDHIVPWAKGGRTEDDNLATVHASCNRAKGNMSVEEFRERMEER